LILKVYLEFRCVKKSGTFTTLSPFTQSACREAWVAVGHPREPRAFLQAPIYLAETRRAALGGMRARV
jgi:hypothetical protein